jgi:hypothetical protein
LKKTVFLLQLIEHPVTSFLWRRANPSLTKALFRYESPSNMTRLHLPLLLLVASASSFAPNVQTVHRLAPLNVGATYDGEWMEHAQSCADSDSCSLEENKLCLENVLRIQSACSAGSLLGDKVCDDVTSAAEIVANLRSKIDKQSKVLR